MLHTRREEKYSKLEVNLELTGLKNKLCYVTLNYIYLVVGTAANWNVRYEIQL